MDIKETSIVVDEGGNSQALSISTTSAPSAAIASGFAVVTLSVAAFVRQGSGTPVALSDGTDQYLLADVAYRLNLKPGNKLAFKTASGTGTAYITPER